MMVITSGIVKITLVEPVTVSVVVIPERSIAVSTPPTVTWVCSAGIVTSTLESPVKMKALVLAAKDSSRLVEENVQVVVNGKSKVTVSPLTVATNAVLASVMTVWTLASKVMVVPVILVCVLYGENTTLVSAAGTSTTEGVAVTTVLQIKYMKLVRLIVPTTTFFSLRCKLRRLSCV